MESVVVDETAGEMPVVRDADDRKFLVLALAGSADALVTGNRDLLVLADVVQGTAIITPAALHERLANG